MCSVSSHVGMDSVWNNPSDVMDIQTAMIKVMKKIAMVSSSAIFSLKKKFRKLNIKVRKRDGK